ncbi:hypothetical protein [Deinococcus sp. Marseille-Q6407]|uniref:hypothetical protein n=1 Tax=Deinococcus sp. Marseille-Q6407 TaxID=2969223 RepID=UPI0021C03800|nr:hypothetical protein [Deinococcus sp. Marseille-Q6407]
MNLRLLFSLLLLAATAALVGWQAQQTDLQGHPLLPDSQTLQCSPTYTFRQAYPEPAQDIKDHAANLMINGWLELDVCSPGVLTIQAESALANNQGPRLEIALNSVPIFEEEIRQPQELRIPVSRAGHLTVGYFNDFYSSEYRAVSLQDFKLQSDACSSFEVTVPGEGGGSWNRDTNFLSFVLGTRATLQPCAAGQLSLKLAGSAAAGQAPMVVFRQNGRELKRVTAESEPVTLTLPVSASPLEIQFLNPYFKELGDRNLYLKHIEFIPEQRP